MKSQFLNRPIDTFANRYTFVCGRTTFILASDYSEAIDEVHHYLPAHSFMLSGAPEWELVFGVDPEAERAIRQRVTANDERVYVKDDFGYVRLDSGAVQEFVSGLGYEQHDHVVLVNYARRRLAIIAAAADMERIRMPLRIVREISLRSLENEGGCFAHAAAVSSADGTRSVFIVGAKAQGKSTTMWNLMLRTGSSYIANDRCILHQEADQLMIYGWPISIRVGMGTVEATQDCYSFEQLTYRRTQVAEFWEQSTTTQHQATQLWGNINKLEMTPLELTERTTVRCRQVARVTSVCLPGFQLGTGPVRLVPCTQDEAILVLDDNLREPADPAYLRGWLGIRTASDEDLIASMQQIRDQLLALPIWRLIGDPRYIPDSIGALQELLHE